MEHVNATGAGIGAGGALFTALLLLAFIALIYQLRRTASQLNTDLSGRLRAVEENLGRLEAAMTELTPRPAVEPGAFAGQARSGCHVRARRDG